MKGLYLVYLQETNFLRSGGNIDIPRCSQGCRMKTIDLFVCTCVPAARQLLALGVFPCAPLAPTLTVDLSLLELVRELFARMSPNMTAWCEAFEAVLFSRGHKEGIRRRFGTAYHWYIVLRLSVEDNFRNLLSPYRTPLLTPPSPDTRSQTPPSSDEYLRERCPLPDAILCIDACFTQKRQQQDHLDDPRNPSRSFFLPEDEITTMEAKVEELRGPVHSKARGIRKNATGNPDEEDGYEPGMRVPTSVLEGCNDSFLAADERRDKASTRFFVDTGIMALLCRHDRVLWLANMTSAGKKQHYALALINRFFQHVDNAFVLGLLYDIGCQLEHSCCKWGFLQDYLPRICFGISVFHAFGHQWPCQLLYHLRKYMGFGLSDGEGCERFWSAIRPLIPSLRVSGRHQRLFVIDSQVGHLDQKSLTNLGMWLRRCWLHCQDKKRASEAGMQLVGIPRCALWKEWRAQVSEQTKPMPRRSRNKGAEAVEVILALEKSLDLNRIVLTELTTALVGTSDNVAELSMQMTEYNIKIDKIKNAIQSRKSLLGIDDQVNLLSLCNSVYLQARMNARALKQRMRDRLRQRKFEVEKIERSYRKTVNEYKLRLHTESSVRRREPGIVKLATAYNNLCTHMRSLVRQGKAPPGISPPQPIARDGLFHLDIDDDIWQDLGLQEDDSSDPPPWLADEKVRRGIQWMLELDRCLEEEERLKEERCFLQEWVVEEWRRVETACQDIDEEHVVFHLRRRADFLKELSTIWCAKVNLIPCAWPMPISWGAPELHGEQHGNSLARADLSGVDNEDEDGDGDDEDHAQQSESGSLDSLLDAVEDFALAEEYRYQDYNDFNPDAIDDDLFNMAPLSSPVRQQPRKRRISEISHLN
ncbi:hypothetical protein BU15DRAFT_90924 [Melanogaster broomeanus]|nr:hypothetical protein BU15DRAFT_90924 [Melanogaster broomeanus]